MARENYKGRPTIEDRRVLFVVNSPNNFLNHRRPLAEALAERGATVEVASPKGQNWDELEASSFPLHHYWLRRSSLAPWNEARAVASLTHQYERVEPDLVHQSTLKPVIYGTLAARAARVPAVVNAITGLGSVFARDGIKARVLRSVVTRGLALGQGHPNVETVLQNQDDFEDLVSRGAIDPDRTVLIEGSGVDVERFKSSKNGGDEDAPLVVLPARMIEEKGIAEFREAGRILSEDGVQSRLALVGKSPEPEASAVPPSELERWEDSGDVEWWGWREDMSTVYKAADIVCLPTKYREGVPKVLLEGAASGKPLVGTDVPGSREIVRDGETGFLVPPGDAEALAAALRQLIENPERRRDLGSRARSVAVDEFSKETVVVQHMEVYERLLSESATG